MQTSKNYKNMTTQTEPTKPNKQRSHTMQTTYTIINHNNYSHQDFSTPEEAKLNLDGPECELRVCYVDGTYEVIVPQTKYKV